MKIHTDPSDWIKNIVSNYMVLNKHIEVHIYLASIDPHLP
jgi:hypothetical protein